MKFTQGHWFKRENVDLHSAVEVDTVAVEDDSFEALLTTKHIRHRGDTLNHPTITLNIGSPSDGILSAVATHFAGAIDSDIRFELFPHGKPESSKVSVQETDEAVTLKSGQSTAKLDKAASSFRLQMGPTYLGFGSLQHIRAPDTMALQHWPVGTTTVVDPYYRTPQPHGFRGFMSVSFALAPDEKVYGLGERFGSFVKNGQSVEIWNDDYGTSSSGSYKNIPFYITNKGYGVFFDHTSLVSFEIQTERLSKVNVSVQGEQIRWFVIEGSSPKDILGRYTQLTGRPRLPPAWTFGMYLSTSFLTDYSEQTTMDMLNKVVHHKLPMTVLHFDTFWMRSHRLCDFVFDPKQFPDPRAFLSRIHERGLKVCVWINPYIAQASHLFKEGHEKGYLLKRQNGYTFQSDTWNAGIAFVDFTNPDACAWYSKQLENLLDIGVDTFKTDFGERIPFEDIVYANNASPESMHNYYPQLYNQTVFSTIARKRGADEVCVFARSATSGGQRMPLHWGGDCQSSWTGMAESLRGGLSLGLAGFGFYAHDIAGFMNEGQKEALPDAALYKRWSQFGLLSSHSRFHGSREYRVPWLIDEESVAVVKKFGELKNRLMPYLWAQAHEAAQKGVPVLRAMFLEFPEDKTAWSLDLQYMLGSSLLVAPVFGDSEVEYYVPKGVWVGLIDGVTRTGPGWFKESHGFLSLPLLVRQDHVILVSDHYDLTEYDYTEDVTAVAGHLSKQVTAVTYSPKGTRAQATIDPKLNFHAANMSVKSTMRLGENGNL